MVSVSFFGVRFSVMFHFMFVHFGKNLAKKQKCSVPCSVLTTFLSSHYIDEKINLSSKICFRFRLIYISKFIGHSIYYSEMKEKS